jgi:hypothetical protein
VGRSEKSAHVRAIAIERAGPTCGGSYQVKFADESMAIILCSVDAHDQSTAGFSSAGVLDRRGGLCGNGCDCKSSGKGNDSVSGQKVLHVLYGFTELNFLRLRKNLASRRQLMMRHLKTSCKLFKTRLLHHMNIR